MDEGGFAGVDDFDSDCNELLANAVMGTAAGHVEAGDWATDRAAVADSADSDLRVEWHPEEKRRNHLFFDTIP